jgi:rhomboid protease GluP
MDGDFNFDNLSDEDLCDRIQRISPVAARLNYTKIKSILESRGYLVRRSESGLSTFVDITPERREKLIGSTRPLSFPIRFSPSSKRTSWLEPARNDQRFVGAGRIDIDGLSVYLSGRRFGLFWGFYSFLLKGREELSWPSIVNVEAVDNAVRFEYPKLDSANGVVTFWVADAELAGTIARALPTERSPGFTPQLEGQLEFERALIARSPRTPVTRGLIALNTLVFLALGLAGVGWMTADGGKLVAWDSNFGPYTTDGDWWRPLTAMFIHSGVIHLAFNMWALASFGPVVERIYGSTRYASLYVVAGLAGGLASVAWNPGVNSVGASGAIFGVLGALLATWFSTDAAIAREVLRPLRASTLIFAAASLVSGLSANDIDNANHLGGLVAGLFMGLALVRPIDQRTKRRLATVGQWAGATVAALILLGAAGAAAKYRANFLTGDALYYHTIHWFIPGEVKALQLYQQIGTQLDNHAITKPQFAAELEAKVIPFWAEARDRFNTIDLGSDDALDAKLEKLQEVAEQRLESYAHCAHELHHNKADAVSTCRSGNERVDALINSWKASK